MSRELATIEQAEEVLQQTLEELHNEAEKNKGTFNSGKAVGLSGLVLGGVGCIALPVLGIPSAIGAFGLYAYSLLSECTTTGEITPIPYASTRLHTLALGALQEAHGISDDELEFAEYLPKRDRILYLLILCQGERLATMLSRIPRNRWRPTIEAVITKTDRILKHAGTKLDYTNAFNMGDEIVDHAEKTLGLPVSRQIPPKTEQKQIIGTNTRLGAVEVQSQSIEQAEEPLEDFWSTPNEQPKTDWNTEIPKVDYVDYVKAICNRNNSFYIVGSKGAGKGMFAANLLRWKLEQYPNAICLALDPKGDIKESGYWNHPRIEHFSFKGMMMRSAEIEEKVSEFLQRYFHLVGQADVTQGKRVFVVFDEFLFLKTNLSKETFLEVSKACSNAISTGDSEGIHAIAITQSFNAGDSTGSDEILKNLTQVGLFREDEYARAKKQVRFGRMNADDFSSSDFSSLCRKSPVSRVMSIAGEFIPTPQLTNYSSFNRDTGEVVSVA